MSSAAGTGLKRPRARHCLVAASLLLLAAGCGKQPENVPPAQPFIDPGHVLTGEWRLDYALTPTQDLPAEIAGSYGIVQRRNLALLAITMAPKNTPGVARVAPLELEATAISLSGQRVPLSLARHDDAGGPTWLATVEIRHRVPVTIEIRARASAELPPITARWTREFHLD